MHDSHQLAQKAGDIAADFDGRPYGCAHCTLAGIHEALGIHDALLARAATGLSAESGLSAEGTCGAYTGAVLAMSSIFGPAEPYEADGDTTYRGFDLARRLFNRFMDRYGTLRCSAIRHRERTGRSPSSPEGAVAQCDARRSSHCRETCRCAASWATEILLAEADRSGATLSDVRNDFSRSRRRPGM